MIWNKLSVLRLHQFPLLPLIFTDIVDDNTDTNTDFALINVFNRHAGQDPEPTTRLLFTLVSPSSVVRPQRI